MEILTKSKIADATRSEVKLNGRKNEKEISFSQADTCGLLIVIINWNEIDRPHEIDFSCPLIQLYFATQRSLRVPHLNVLFEVIRKPIHIAPIITIVECFQFHLFALREKINCKKQ